MTYTTQQLTEITGAKLIGSGSLTVKQIVFDSRKIYAARDNAFIAINTAKNSGEKYIKDALERGIKIIIAEKHVFERPDITWIIVENSIKFLHTIAAFHVKHLGLKTIGITGSNGKTIVKEWLYQCLRQDFSCVKSPKSFNSQLGLPVSVLEAEPGNDVGIFEVGISKPGEMNNLLEILAPEIGLLTHIGTAHAANFKDEEQLINEKLKLFSRSRLIIYNGDNDTVCEKIQNRYADRRLTSFGLKKHNNIHLLSKGSSVSPTIVSVFGEHYLLSLQHHDHAVLNNSMAVIAVLREIGFSKDKIIEKTANLRAVEMRLESIIGVRNNVIINDSYNLDLDSLKIAYQFITEYNRKNRTLILTDFVDGKNPAETYSKAAELTNAQHFDNVFLIGDEISSYKKLFIGEVAAFVNVEELIKRGALDALRDELVLLKGARKFGIEKIQQHLQLQKHDTVLEVNLNSILHNINAHKAFLKPETKMMAMVKANSYGLGDVEIAEFLQHHHIDYLGVAFADEGVTLRKNGITTPIMVMNPEQYSYDTIIDFNLEPEVYSMRVLDQFYDRYLAKGIQQKYPIHIKLETGMHRLGFHENMLDELLDRIKLMNVRVVSIFSHLSSADDLSESEYTHAQAETFGRSAEKLINGLGYRPILHILNSSGITNYSEYQHDMVRIGIGMLGVSSNEAISKSLKSAVTFKSVISQISVVNQGDSVGYNRRYRADTATRIATIPVGYADGVRRMVGNGRGFVSINKQLFPIVGNVCMDMLMVDIGNFETKEGEEVVIFNASPSLQDFANYSGTIPYEVLPAISKRVKRIYIKD